MSTGPLIAHEDIKGCNRLQDKTILVTAGTQGIGRAIAERCIQEGALVFLCSRKQKNVDETLDEIKSKYKTSKIGGCICNVSYPEDLQNFLQESYKFFAAHLRTTEENVQIDGLVANAAVNPFVGNTLETPDSMYAKIFKVNLESAWKLVQLTKPRLVSGSSIVFISSIAGFLPGPLLGLYGVSKSAMNSLAKVLAKDLGNYNVRVNAVAPGVIKTRFSSPLWKGLKEGERAIPTFLPRIGEPADCAGPVAFLLSSDAGYITGETLIVAGGRQSRI